jgi:hypothetical protein
VRHRLNTVSAPNAPRRRRARAPDRVEDLLADVEDPLAESWLRGLLKSGEVTSWEIRPQQSGPVT